MYGAGGVSYPEAKARLIDEEMVEAIGEWGKRRGGLARKGDATVGQRTRPGVARGDRRAPGRTGGGGGAGGGLQGKATLPWGNVHGLVSLVAIEGLPGGQEVERLVRQAVGGLLRPRGGGQGGVGRP